MVGLLDILAIQQQQAQAYNIGKGFAQIMERLDWIGQKLDGEDLKTNYRDIIIKHQQKTIDELAEKLNPRYSEEVQCCCEHNTNKRDISGGLL